MGTYACKQCNIIPNVTTDEYIEDVFNIDEENDMVVCGSCNTQLSFIPKISDRSVDAEFDPALQVYRNRNGEILVEQYEDTMSCPRCDGPSECYAIDAYYEYNRCANCKHEFKVN